MTRGNATRAPRRAPPAKDRRSGTPPRRPARSAAGPTGPPRRPSDLSIHSWLQTLRRTVLEFQADHLLQSAAALAFFSALSLFPALLALVALLGLIGADALEPLISNAGALTPGTTRDIALDALHAIRAGDTADATFAAGLVIALWSSSSYVGALIPASNAVWEVANERPLWKRLVVRVGLTFALLVVIAATALVVVITGPIARELGSILGAGDAAVAAWEVAKWPFLAAMLMLLVLVLYWAAPNVRHPGVRWLLPGGVLAVAVWIAASVGFALYVSHFGTYSAVYGGIGGVLVFLIWLWLSNIAILLGAELNAELERTRAIEGGMRPVDRTPYLPPRDGNGTPIPPAQ